MNNYIKVGAICLIVGGLIGWTLRRPPVPPVFPQQELDSLRVEGLRWHEQYLVDSAYTAQVEDSLHALQEAHNKTPIKDRVSNASKAIRNASVDSLGHLLMRPIH